MKYFGEVHCHCLCQPILKSASFWLQYYAAFRPIVLTRLELVLNDSNSNCTSGVAEYTSHKKEPK